MSSIFSLVQYGATTPITTSSIYDFWTGHVTSLTGANNQTTNAYYNDPLDRPTQVVRAAGTGDANQTTFSYDDVAGIVSTTTDLNSYGDNTLKSQTLYDGLGRVVETRKYETTADYIATRQVPFVVLQDGSNWLKASQISNPFRPYLNEQPVWTTSFNDSLNRVIKVTTPDNAVVATGYSGNTVTVTDQAGKKRKSVKDALGRLRAVVEDPFGVNYQTSYGYDVLDNLVSVTQDSQQRFFMYDSLKRLIRARNPEQSTLGSLALSDPITGNSAWAIGYEYDANGNLTKKTDPRGVETTYVYDALNRSTTTNYSDTTIDPDVKRFYDGATYGKGRFWYVYTGGDYSTGANVDLTSIDSYDALGRPLVQRQLFKLNNVWSATYQTSRAYNRAGGVISQTYPSVHSVTYNYDQAGRVANKDDTHLAFTGNLGDGVLRTYAAGITYTPWGSLNREQYGTSTSVYNKLHYNIRGQLCDVRASNVNEEWSGELGALVNYYTNPALHCGSAPDNNGNILMSETIINSVYFQDRYTYDTLNRLTAVNEYLNGTGSPTGSQQYQYDRWGNRTIIPSSPSLGFNTSFDEGWVALNLNENKFKAGFHSYEEAKLFSDPPYEVSQLDGTLEVASYISVSRITAFIIRVFRFALAKPRPPEEPAPASPPNPPPSSDPVTLDEVFEDPKILTDKTLEEVRDSIGDTPGWNQEVMRHSQSNPGGGWILREYNENGAMTGRMIQYHPGGGRHGPLPYWKISSGNTGTVRVPAGQAGP